MSNTSAMCGDEIVDGGIVDCWTLYSEAASRSNDIDKGSWVLRSLGDNLFLVLGRSSDKEDIDIAFWDLSIYRYAEGTFPESDDILSEVSYAARRMLIRFMTERMPWRRWAWTPSMAQEALDSGNWEAIGAWLRTDMGLMVAYDKRLEW